MKATTLSISDMAECTWTKSRMYSHTYSIIVSQFCDREWTCFLSGLQVKLWAWQLEALGRKPYDLGSILGPLVQLFPLSVPRFSLL